MATVAVASSKHVLGAEGDYTIDTYPYQPDDVYAQIGHRSVNMDIGLLRPQDGAPTLGFYAALDTAHGEPFSDHWKTTYRRFLALILFIARTKGKWL